MLPDRVSNPGPLTYESVALPIALRGPACMYVCMYVCMCNQLLSHTVLWRSKNKTRQEETICSIAIRDSLKITTYPTMEKV